ncbi:hypothetical protein [Sulfitobacter pontiacus]|uniref:hypothetical protein n=1 Tax=Sulfitobacter pontiacus TaxID=60137 RepID=UPI0013621FE6|nr:hypothetical protein [Sulfitobacter pontiacus]
MEDILYLAKSVLVKVPEENVLSRSFGHQLPAIALGVTNGSQLMAVQKLFKLFSSTYDRKALELGSGPFEHFGEGGGTGARFNFQWEHRQANQTMAALISSRLTRIWENPSRPNPSLWRQGEC